jgi:hypothetical protein
MAWDGVQVWACNMCARVAELRWGIVLALGRVAVRKGRCARLAEVAEGCMDNGSAAACTCAAVRRIDLLGV